MQLASFWKSESFCSLEMAYFNQMKQTSHRYKLLHSLQKKPRNTDQRLEFTSGFMYDTAFEAISKSEKKMPKNNQNN